jgi:hypothetical protein
MLDEDKSFKLMALRKRRSDLLENLTLIDRAIDELTTDKIDHSMDGADPDVPVVLRPLNARL